MSLIFEGAEGKKESWTGGGQLSLEVEGGGGRGLGNSLEGTERNLLDQAFVRKEAEVRRGEKTRGSGKGGS